MKKYLFFVAAIAIIMFSDYNGVSAGSVTYYCVPGFTGELTTAQEEVCKNQDITEYEFISEHDYYGELTQLTEDLFKLEFGRPVTLDYCTSNFDKIDTILRGRYIYSTYYYNDTKRYDFNSGDYFYDFIWGWKFWTNDEDYHKKYEIYEKCQEYELIQNRVYLDTFGYDDIYVWEIIDELTPFECNENEQNYAGRCPTNEFTQYYVPVRLILAEVITEYIYGEDSPLTETEKNEIKLKFQLPESEPYHYDIIFTVETNDLLDIIEEIKLVEPYLIIVKAVKAVMYVHKWYEEMHRAEVEEMLDFVNRFILDPGNIDKYIVFSHYDDNSYTGRLFGVMAYHNNYVTFQQHVDHIQILYLDRAFLNHDGEVIYGTIKIDNYVNIIELLESEYRLWHEFLNLVY